MPVARVQAFDDGPVRPVDRGLGLEPRLSAGVAEVHVDLELDAVPAPARRRVSGDPKPRRRPRRAPHLARDHRFQVLRPGHPERHRLSRHLPAGDDQRGSPAVHRRDDALADEAIDAHLDQRSVVVHGSPVRSQVRGRRECRPSRRRTGRAVRGTNPGRLQAGRDRAGSSRPARQGRRSGVIGGVLVRPGTRTPRSPSRSCAVIRPSRGLWIDTVHALTALLIPDGRAGGRGSVAFWRILAHEAGWASSLQGPTTAATSPEPGRGAGALSGGGASWCTAATGATSRAVHEAPPGAPDGE